MEEIVLIRFSPKAITFYFEKEEGFDYKNNYGPGKLASFRLDKISKNNCRMLAVLSYTLSVLGTKKFQLV